jgi:hypothetical protein
MELAGRGDGSDFYGLRLKPELLTVLRHAGIDVLAYDDTVSEIAGNLRRVAQGCAQHPGVTLRVRTMDDQPWRT